MALQTSTSPSSSSDIAAAEAEISTLEAQLLAAKTRLDALRLPSSSLVSPSPPPSPLPTLLDSSPASSNTHFLLLLADSALPLGSFAFSSGLESFLAHTPTTPTGLTSSSSSSSSSSSTATSTSPLTSFLPESISSFAATTLPFALAAWRNPQDLVALDDEMDATVLCTVARRASTAQGRALLSLWERSFLPSMSTTTTTTSTTSTTKYHAAIATFSQTMRSTPSCSSSAAHLAPLFGAISRACGLSCAQTAYVAVLNHARAVVSAAVRAGILGPYMAQRVLAGHWLRDMLERAVDREWNVKTEDAAQRVVVLDLWMGRHELLYSRIFNS